MSMLDTAISRAQTALLILLRDTATMTHTPLVSDGRGGYVPGDPETISTPCNVQRTLKAEEQAEADRVGVVSPAIIRLPVGTVVTSADTITVGVTTFQVVAPLVDTMQLTLSVLCKEL